MAETIGVYEPGVDIDEDRVLWFRANWPSVNAKPSEIREAERKLSERDKETTNEP